MNCSKQVHWKFSWKTVNGWIIFLDNYIITSSYDLCAVSRVYIFIIPYKGFCKTRKLSEKLSASGMWTNWNLLENKTGKLDSVTIYKITNTLELAHLEWKWSKKYENKDPRRGKKSMISCAIQMQRAMLWSVRKVNRIEKRSICSKKYWTLDVLGW